MAATRLPRNIRRRGAAPPVPVGEQGEVHRCRLCAANDVDGLIEQLAEELWDSRRYGTLDDVPWAVAGEYWQRTFRELTETVLESLHANHPGILGS